MITYLVSNDIIWPQFFLFFSYLAQQLQNNFALLIKINLLLTYTIVLLVGTDYILFLY